MIMLTRHQFIMAILVLFLIPQPHLSAGSDTTTEVQATKLGNTTNMLSTKTVGANSQSRTHKNSPKKQDAAQKEYLAHQARHSILTEAILYFITPIIFIIIDFFLTRWILTHFGFKSNKDKAPSKEYRSADYRRTEYLLVFILISLLIPLLLLMFSFVLPDALQAHQLHSSASSLLKLFITVLGFLGGLFVYFRWQDERFKKDIRDDVRDEIEKRFGVLEKDINSKQKEELSKLQRDIHHLVALTVAEHFDKAKRRIATFEQK